MSSELPPDEVIALNRLATLARVLSGTAHDVNNALQIIGGSAELLESQVGLTDSAKRAITRIRGQAARAAVLIDDLTRFGRAHGEPAARVAIKDVVVKAASLRAMMIRRGGFTLAFDDVASPAAEVTGQAAPLLQAVLNVIMNAEQALDRRKGGAITLVLSEEGGHAVLRALDNGADLQDAARPPAFDAVEANRPTRETTGLGLDAARLIARAHAGDLTLDPVPSGGCVTLRLPLAGR